MRKLVYVVLITTLIIMPLSVSAQETNVRQGEHIALSISKLTGMAINPLLVTACIGVYKNFIAPSDADKQLPWYSQSWFVAICGILAVLGFCVSIPTITLNFPPQLSALSELLNKKIGLALTTPAILDMVNPIAAPLAENVYTALNTSHAYMYASLIPLEWLAGVPELFWLALIQVMFFFTFIAIWMLNYTFDALIFLCPFGWVDAFLKTVRGAVYAALAALSVTYPPLAFIVTLPIIIISLILFGWSVRRVVMASVFLRDFFNRKKETIVDDKGIIAFSESGLKMPAKRMGRFREENGKWSFTYKKYFLIKKTVFINKTESVLKKGFLYSEIRNKINNKEISICSLSPRYQKITEQVQTCLGIQTIVESKLKKGLKATLEWVKDLFKRTNIDAVPELAK